MTGWRYSHAGQAGPDGTDSGVLWIDAEQGIVLGFDARDLGEHDHRMQAVDVSYDKLDDDTFALPKATQIILQNLDSSIPPARSDKRLP